MRSKKCTFLLTAILSGSLAMTTVGADARPSAGPDDSWVAALEGGWAGQDNRTPMGTMPFAMVFSWEADGTLHNHSALNRETFVDLRFRKSDDGSWLLVERAGLEGVGDQEHTLAPAPSGAPGTHRWIQPDLPGFLVIDVAVREGRMKMSVILRGREHASFDLARVPEDELPQLTQYFEEARLRSPEETSIHDLESEPMAASDPIERAREEVQRHPGDAEARMQLARLLSEAIQADPMTAGPRHAFELLQTLETALKLDPGNVETYHYLVGYHLNAPPIAGGSLDRAEELARALVEIDPAAGTRLLEEVTGRRSGSSRASS